MDKFFFTHWLWQIWYSEPYVSESEKRNRWEQYVKEYMISAFEDIMESQKQIDERLERIESDIKEMKCE